jgi:RHS repeat-associated protein
VDQLGSTRLVTDQSGNVVGRHDYLPFGEEVGANMAGRNGQWGSTADLTQRFTGKERDSETGMDFFGARYYGSALGRWTSPDLVNLTDDRILNPSNTINKYIYGGNNPLKYVDPDGEDITLFYTNGGTAGHAMLLAYNQQTGDSAVQSFGPANHSNATELEMFVGIPVPGTANYGFQDIKSPDQLRQEYSSITIQTSPEETQKAIQYIRTHSDGNYDTYTNNCTTTCAKILRDLKLYRYAPIIPQALFSTLADQYSKTKFNRPQDVPQHGKDYGNPRPGYDPFDLLFLSIQQQSQPAPQPVVTSKICYTDDNGTQHCQ